MTTTADLDGRTAAQGLLESAVDTELQRGEGTDHDETGWQAGEGADEAELLGELGQETDGGLAGRLLDLVDLGQEGVGGLGDDGGGETGGQTTEESDTGVDAGGEGLLGADDAVVQLGGALEDEELGDVVWDLLEQDWGETVVERADTFFLQDSGETANETVGKTWLGHKSDSGGLERAQRNVGDELSNSGRTHVHGVLVVASSVVAQQVDELLLEHLVTTELERTLDRVAEKCRTETGQQRTRAFLTNNLLERGNHALVVNRGLELDSRLDDVDRHQRTVRGAAADGAGERKLEVVGGSVVWDLGGHIELYRDSLG